SLDDPDLWMPAVEGTSPEGPVVGVVSEATRLRRAERRLPIPGPRTTETAPAAPDVVELLRYLRTELQRRRVVDDGSALYASRVREDIWSQAERGAQDTGARLVAYLSDEEATTLELPIRRTGFGELATALHDRGGIAAFLAPDEDGLAGALGRYLAAEDFLRFATEVEVHAPQAPRADPGEGPAPVARAHAVRRAHAGDVHDARRPRADRRRLHGQDRRHRARDRAGGRAVPEPLARRHRPHRAAGGRGPHARRRGRAVDRGHLPRAPAPGGRGARALPARPRADGPGDRRAHDPQRR